MINNVKIPAWVASIMVAASLMAACGGGEPEPIVTVYKEFVLFRLDGPAPTEAEDLEHELTQLSSAGVLVSSARCVGLTYPSSGTGVHIAVNPKAYLFDVTASNLEKAKAYGFALFDAAARSRELADSRFDCITGKTVKN